MAGLPLLSTLALEQALNAALRLDPQAPGCVAELAGKVIAIEISGIGVRLYLIPTHERLRVQGVFDGAPDVLIRGGPLSLARLGLDRGQTPAGQFASIEGDMDTARHVQRLLAAIDIDWEEHLSRLMGDVAAHQLGNVARGASAWIGKTSATLAQDVVEYLQHERRDLVARPELDEFLGGVDVLRSDADRIEARVQRLQRVLKEQGEA